MTAPIRGASLTTTFSDLTNFLSVLSKPSPFDVFVSDRRFGSDVAKPIKILFRSEVYYWVNERELADLRAGYLPEELGLEPYEPEDE